MKQALRYRTSGKEEFSLRGGKQRRLSLTIVSACCAESPGCGTRKGNLEKGKKGRETAQQTQAEEMSLRVQGDQEA